MASTSFHESLTPLRSFARLADPTVYAPLPPGWVPQRTSGAYTPIPCFQLLGQSSRVAAEARYLIAVRP